MLKFKEVAIAENAQDMLLQSHFCQSHLLLCIKLRICITDLVSNVT